MREANNLCPVVLCLLFPIACRALVELVKYKPSATKEQLKKVVGDFTAMLEKCCAADDKEACFSEEVLELCSLHVSKL